MDHVEIDLRAIERGTVTAPAGCGKTQLIAHALAGHRGNKPILVLTHTNAVGSRPCVAGWTAPVCQPAPID
jgi:DNA helicase-2/ATP-dependent DNA helicase PcrA